MDREAPASHGRIGKDASRRLAVQGLRPAHGPGRNSEVLPLSQ
jgi:hypothetical protein